MNAFGLLDFALVINPILFPNLVVKKMRQETIEICQRIHAQRKAKKILINPEMMTLHQHIHELTDYEIGHLPSYDLIALTLLQSDQFAGVLPSGMLPRFPEIKSVKKIASADLCLVYHSELTKNKSVQAIVKIFSKVLKAE